MTEINKTKIEKLSILARISLSEEEKEGFSKDISSILDYVAKLDEVEAGDLIETSEIDNVYAEDVAEKCEVERDEILKNAPMTEDGFIKVKSVLD